MTCVCRKICLTALILCLLHGCSEMPAAGSDSASVPAAAETDAARIDTLRLQLAALQARKLRIEDSNAIKRLQRSFGYYMSEGQWDQVAALFSEDATFEFGRDGVYRGRARILAWLQTFGGNSTGLREGQLNEFFQLMPVLTLDESGSSAKARWRGIMLLGKLGEQALWGEGPYENEYVKEGGIWKFSKLRWFQTIAVPYAGGWVQHEDVNKGIWVSPQLPADAPPTATYGSWPETFLPPFSFANPVGRYQSAVNSGEQP